MLVGESSRRSSLRVLYGILAQSALQQFDAPEQEERRVAYFHNLITLLEMYRYETLRQPSHRAVFDRRETPRSESKLEKLEADTVERALKTAHDAVYNGQTKEEMVEHLKLLFARVIRKDFDIDPEQIQRAKRFLETFAKALRK